MFRVRFVRRVEEQRGLATLAGLSTIGFSVIALDDEAE
jgi:hypothetical protein